jgi:hypothetical protein
MRESEKKVLNYLFNLGFNFLQLYMRCVAFVLQINIEYEIDSNRNDNIVLFLSCEAFCVNILYMKNYFSTKRFYARALAHTEKRSTKNYLSHQKYTSYSRIYFA